MFLCLLDKIMESNHVQIRTDYMFQNKVTNWKKSLYVFTEICLQYGFLQRVNKFNFELLDNMKLFLAAHQIDSVA